MDSAEIRFIRKAFIKERCAEVLRIISPSPILGELFKDSVPSPTAFDSFGNSEMNCQRGNKMHRAIGIIGTRVGFFKG
jgi:hypothetical protein